MKRSGRTFVRTIIALAVCAAFAPARGQEADTAALTKPDSAARAGIGLASGDPRERSIFGQYNGLRDHDANLLLDLDLVRRDDATGTWTVIRGRNLGLDNRDLSATLQKQGDWRLSIDYGELVHHEIRTINSGLLGAGSPAPQVVLLPSPGSGSDLNLSVQRKALGLSGDKWISHSWQAEVSFKNEDKTGARFWGRGYDCAAVVCAQTPAATRFALLMLPEPINTNTKQIDAKLNYHTDKLFLSGGYYGSFFTNYNGSLVPVVPPALNAGTLNGAAPTGVFPTGGTSLQNVLQSPMALPPDNQAHQFYVSGNYAFTPKLNSTFKLARTHATQNEDFGGMGFVSGLNAPPAGRTNLGGVLDTTLVQLGATARPTAKLSLLGNFRFEDRDDKTPIDLYNVENSNFFTNGHISLRKMLGKAEASYALPAATRGTLGVDYEVIDRGSWVQTDAVAGLTGLRQKTWETTYRGELRRSIGETLTGALGVSHGVRDGSIWLKPNALPATGVVPMSDTQIFNRVGMFPYSMTDRVRDAVKASADWTPTERLSFSFVGQASRDHYGDPSTKGLLRGGSRLWSVDGAYTLTEAWKLNAYASFGDQSSQVAMSTATNDAYNADIHDRNMALGFGTAGKLSGQLEVGAKLSYLRDVTKYGLAAGPLSSLGNVQQNAIGLPDVKFRETRLNLYSVYTLRKNSDVRLDFVRYVAQLDEWAWGYNGVPFTYGDNTTVSLNPNQHVTFVAASYVYKF